MKYAIRTQLTFLIAFVFLALIFFFMITGAIALYFGLNETIDQQLAIESKRMTELFESEYCDLLVETGDNRKLLRDEFVEDLNEMCQYKHQFVLFSLTTNNGRRVYSGGELKNIQLLLSKVLFTLQDGCYNQRFNGRFYRVYINRKGWGRLILGMENETFFEVVDEFKEIFLIGIPIILVLIYLGGKFLARRAMRPVVATAETADKMSLTNLEQRFFEYNKNDEFGILTKTLNNMLARLETGIRRIQQFTQDAAHELRTPLTILRGELELLYQQSDLSEEYQSALQKALDRTIILNKIVDDLMLLAQSDSGQYPLHKTSFCLDQVIKETLEDVKILGESYPIEVVLSQCDEIEFWGDEQLIRRLFLNLADNALKYTQQGRIDFSLKSQNNEIEIKISDTGIGIPEEDLPHIFDRFYRVDKARTTAKGGSGLGLSISKWIVEAHDGQIQIESTLSTGTVITITFPQS